MADLNLDNPAVVELRRYLYDLPVRFGLQHDRILYMRRELRVVLLTALTKNHSSLLFGPHGVPERCFLPPQQWNSEAKQETHSHHGRPCARKLERGEPTHRCLTCGVDDTCVLCVYCYNPADHVGHNVFVKVSSRDDGGICDCGDAEAWTRDLHCASYNGPEGTLPLPADFTRQASIVLDTVFDFVVDVLSMSSLVTQGLRSVQEIEELGRASDLIPRSYGVRPPGSEPADPLTEPLGSTSPVKYALLVWDDYHRSQSDLFSVLKLATQRRDKYLHLVLNQVQISGRAVVDVSDNIEDLIVIQKRIRNFGTSIRRLKDVMREEMVVEILRVAVDLCHCPVYNHEPTSLMNLVGKSLMRPWRTGVPPWSERLAAMETSSAYAKSNLVYYDIPVTVPSECPTYGEDRGDLDVELYGPHNILGTLSNRLSKQLWDKLPKREYNWPLENSRVRVKYLIFFDIRMYKLVRQKLLDLYISALVSNLDLKMQVAIVYADIYPILVDLQSNIDCDPELSVTTSLSTQLFTTPSIATKLMEGDTFFVYIDMISKQYISKGSLNPAAFKNRRLCPIFHELRNLLWRNNDKALVGGDPNRLLQTAQFLAMFQGLAPLVRKIDQHVEYESERWIYCFTIMPYFVQLSRAVAMGVDTVVNDELTAAPGIQGISQSIILWQKGLYSANTHNLANPPRVPTQNFNHSQICVWTDPISMLNPVHWFLSLLIQGSQVNDLSKLREMLCVTDTTDIALFDASLCTLALLSHISVGYWVRNGFSMRVQLQCYRDSTLRDLAYTQDILLTQIAFCVMDPSTVFLNLARHFAVLDWPKHTLGDDQQAQYILDEFVHCLTLLLCDRLRFQNYDHTTLTRELLKKVLIHALGFETMQYSELFKTIPENMSVDDHFDTVLAEIADFTPPQGEQGVGKYALKKSMYEFFDPYYTHFTSSKTEEAVRVSDEKLGPLHLPPLLPLKGAWARLSVFTRTESFADFFIKVLDAAPRTVDRVVHLLLMAAKDDKIQYPNQIHEEAGVYPSVANMVVHHKLNGTSLLDRLLTVSPSPRIGMLLDLLRDIEPSIPEYNRVPVPEQDAKKQQKERAKAMQAKVMADFARQQEAFLANNSENVLDDSDSSDSMDVECDGYVFPKQCVYCRMQDQDNSVFGILTYTSKSDVLRNLPLQDPHWMGNAFSEDPSLDIVHPSSTPLDLNNTEECQPDVSWGVAFPKNDIRETTLIQGCGHFVHYKCYQEFVRQHHIQRLSTIGSTIPEDEFLCPLCRGVNNCFLPVLWTANTTSVSEFLGNESLSEMRQACATEFAVGPIGVAETVGFSYRCLQPRFAEALMVRDQNNMFHMHVRDVLQQQLVRIKRDSPQNHLDKGFGLRSLYRAFACCVVHIDVAHRGQNHCSPFGGLLIDQLPDQISQFLRVFSMYIQTLTGFMVATYRDSAAAARAAATPGFKELVLVPNQSFTRVVEMMFLGASIHNISRKTIVKQMLALEFGRVLVLVHRMNTSRVSRISAPDDGVKQALSKLCADPDLVYTIVRYHITLTCRRLALIVYSQCGKYDPDDFAGMMELPEHDRLLKYLQMPSLNEIILEVATDGSGMSMAHQFFMQQYGISPDYRYEFIDYPGIYRLIKLPERLDMMFNVRKKVPAEPAVCLMCGFLCSTQDSGFHELGPCNEHMLNCGVNQGIFLLPRRNVVLLLLPSGRGTFITAPYLDLHGEPDETMRHGRPHYLQPLRYDALIREVWLKNGLPSLIMRKLDQAQDTGGWETL